MSLPSPKRFYCITSLYLLFISSSLSFFFFFLKKALTAVSRLTHYIYKRLYFFTALFSFQEAFVLRSYFFNLSTEEVIKYKFTHSKVFFFVQFFQIEVLLVLWCFGLQKSFFSKSYNLEILFNGTFEFFKILFPVF